MAAPVTDEELEIAILRVVDRSARTPGGFMVRQARIVTEVRRALRPPPAKADVLRVADDLVERGVLDRFARRLLHRPRKERPAPRAAERVRRGMNRCLFPLPPSVTTADLRAALKARFEVVEETPTRLAFRWRTPLKKTGPTLWLTRRPRDELRAITRDERFLASTAGCAVLAFDDRDEVLDEMNTLVEAQAALQAVTRRPYFVMWTFRRVDFTEPAPKTKKNEDKKKKKKKKKSGSPRARRRARSV